MELKARVKGTNVYGDFYLYIICSIILGAFLEKVAVGKCCFVILGLLSFQASHDYLGRGTTTNL